MNIPDKALTVARDAVLADAEYVDEDTLRAALEAVAPLIVAFAQSSEDVAETTQSQAREDLRARLAILAVVAAELEHDRRQNSEHSDGDHAHHDPTAEGQVETT